MSKELRCFSARWDRRTSRTRLRRSRRSRRQYLCSNRYWGNSKERPNGDAFVLIADPDDGREPGPRCRFAAAGPRAHVRSYADPRWSSRAGASAEAAGTEANPADSEESEQAGGSLDEVAAVRVWAGRAAVSQVSICETASRAASVIDALAHRDLLCPSRTRTRDRRRRKSRPRA